MENDKKSNITENDILEFNTILGESDMNFMKLCQKVGMAKSTLQGRLKKAGFQYSKEQSKIISLDEVRTEGNVIIGDNKAHEEPKADINILKEIEALRKRVEALEKERHIVASNLDITINTDQNYNYRTVKLYKDIEKDFDNLCKKNNHISKQNLLNQALSEFTLKHK